MAPVLTTTALAELPDPSSGGGIVATLELAGYGLLAVSAPIILIELWWLARRGHLRWGRFKEMLASYATVVPTVLLAGAALALWLAIYGAAARLSPLDIATTLPTAVLCVVMADFIYYWDHRAGHEIRGLWALYHSVHHSSPVFDQSTAFRISFIDQFVVPVFYLPLVVVGFDPLLVMAGQLIVIAYQSWIHTEMVGRLGWLDKVINTPSAHRVHHAAQPQYRDKNYGGILLVWDHLFGTYQSEASATTYGLVKPILSTNPVEVHFCEARRCLAALKTCSSISQRFRYLFERP